MLAAGAVALGALLGVTLLGTAGAADRGLSPAVRGEQDAIAAQLGQGWSVSILHRGKLIRRVYGHASRPTGTTTATGPTTAPTGTTTATNSTGTTGTTTSTTTSTPLGAPGVVTFSANFDGGTIAHFGGAQCTNNRTPSKIPRYRGSYAFEGSIVGQGTGALAITVPTTPSGFALTACNLNTALAPVVQDQSEYIGLMVYEPAGWTIPNNAFEGVNIYELHTQFVWGSPVTLQLHDNYVALALETGACFAASTSTPGCQFRSNAGAPPCHISGVSCLPGYYAIPPGKLVLGQWNEIIVHAVWSSTSSGQLQTFYKVKGAPTWNVGGSVLGIPTVQWNRTTAGIAGSTIDSLEVYTPRVSSPLTTYFDNAVDGTSFAAVAALMP